MQSTVQAEDSIRKQDINQTGHKREEIYKRYLTPTLKPGLRSTVKDKDLPQIDF